MSLGRERNLGSKEAQINPTSVTTESGSGYCKGHIRDHARDRLQRTFRQRSRRQNRRATELNCVLCFVIEIFMRYSISGGGVRPKTRSVSGIIGNSEPNRKPTSGHFMASKGEHRPPLRRLITPNTTQREHRRPSHVCQNSSRNPEICGGIPSEAIAAGVHPWCVFEPSQGVKLCWFVHGG